MFIDTITYEDFNGNEVSEDVYFNISKMEAIELESSYPGGYSKKLQDCVKSGDNMDVINVFKEFVDLSYGVKSEDGKRFVKSEEELEKFKSSPIYDEFMLKIISDEEYAIDFAIGVFPSVDGLNKKTLMDEVNKENGIKVVHND